ncbi:hypothetical protein BKA25_002940 [Actinoalloteichus hymeniacidonis]|nr:hypothetical protein [Actinoalloteichus hymeniacidonis]
MTKVADRAEDPRLESIERPDTFTRWRIEGGPW